VRSRRAVERAAIEREADLERRRRDEADRRIADERLHIAQEVHDVVAHAMVAINVQAGVAADVLHKRPEHVETALTEIKRVSGAAVRVAIGSRSLEIDVRNDSPAAVTNPPPATNGAGTGLQGMAERAEALGGRIEAGRLPDGGWRVHASFRLHDDLGPDRRRPGARARRLLRAARRRG
jgi:signal transduction histidine kinase